MRRFNNLNQCYDQKFADIQQNGGGAEGFNAETKECYGAVAYVYKSETSVYNVTLQQATPASDYSTPELTQYIYNLPPSSDDGNETLSVIDDIMIAVAFLSLGAGVFYFFRKFFGKVHTYCLCNVSMVLILLMVCRRIAGEFLLKARRPLLEL